MSNPDIQPADYTRALTNLLLLLGIYDRDYPTSPRPVADSPWSQLQVEDLLVQADLEVCGWIIDTPNHPLRNYFDWEASDAIADGEQVPGSFSTHRAVTITDAGGNVQPGTLGTSLEQLLQWRARPDVFGSFPFLYFIQNGKIHFGKSDSTATVDLPQIDREDSDLVAPERYEWAVVANAMKMTAMHKQDAQNKTLYAQLAGYYETQIKEGKLSIPVHEVFQRLAT